MVIFSKLYQTTSEHSATIWGSGSLNVLSTPSLVAFFENVAFIYVEGTLDLGQTTVGTKVNIKHLAASKIGESVTINLLTAHKENNKITFELEAYVDNKLVATCSHERFIIDIDRFLNKL